jgi:hypothetical protein
MLCLQPDSEDLIMFLFHSIAEHLHFLKEDCFPGIESGIMVIKDLIIFDNPDTPSSKDNYIHRKGQIHFISNFRDTFQN